MSLRHLMPRLLAVLVASAATMASAAAQGLGWMSALAAGLFALALIAAVLRINLPLWWRGEESVHVAGPNLEATVVRRNTRLAAVLYGWGAVAMFATYMLSGLSWRHGWQYGTAMALIAAGLLAYAHRMGVDGSTLRSIVGLRTALAFTVAHGAAAAVALVWLVASGKVWSGKADWVANHVFVAGTVSLIALTTIAAITQRKIERRY